MHNRAVILSNRGTTFASLKQREKSTRDYDEAIRLNPAFVEAYYNRGLNYRELKQFDKAIADFSETIRLNPRYARAHLHRGSIYLHQRKFEQANKDYDAVVAEIEQLEPEIRHSAYFNRAIVYGQKRQYNLAIRDSTSAIQLKPKYANAYHNRGAFYYDIGEFDKTIADLSEAIRLDPRGATTFHGRAAVYEDIDQFDKAMADYDRVLRIAPKDADDYAVQGVAYFRKGSYKEAASAVQKALQLSPGNDFAMGRLAWLRATCPDASMRNGKEAIRMSIKACELSKWREPRYIAALAAAYAEMGDFDKAVKFQTQAIDMKSEYGPVDKKTREHLALYRDHKPARSEPLVAR